MGAAWRSRLAPTKHLISRAGCTWLVVSACHWALIVWACEEVAPGLFRLKTGDPKELSWFHICSVSEYLVIDFTGEVVPGYGLLFRVGRSAPFD